MVKFKYSLAKQGKWLCPECGHKTFVCYVDENGNVLDDSVGKCDRANNCGHHYPPRDYFKDNNIEEDYKPSYSSTPPLTLEPEPSYIDPDIFKKTVIGSNTRTNALLKYLEFEGFDADTIEHIKNEYYIGASKHWNGATVFWQVDQFGHVHTGKIMLYNAIEGKRVKEPYNHISWVHTVLKLQNFNLKQCLFGEHLLIKYPNRPVIVVESEKTAMILGGIMDKCVVVACGGCGNLTKAMLRPLIGRNVILSPDNGKFNEWSDKGKALAHMFKRLWITDIMEKCNREEGEDIADLILRKYTSWKLDGEDIINLRWGLLPLY